MQVNVEGETHLQLVLLVGPPKPEARDSSLRNRRDVQGVRVRRFRVRIGG